MLAIPRARLVKKGDAPGSSVAHVARERVAAAAPKTAMQELMEEYDDGLMDIEPDFQVRAPPARATPKSAVGAHRTPAKTTEPSEPGSALRSGGASGTKRGLVLDSSEDDYGADVFDAGERGRGSGAGDNNNDNDNGNDDDDDDEEKQQQQQAAKSKRPKAPAAPKDVNKELRDLARINQQLMIQTALLGKAPVARKTARKMDVTAFAERLKQQLMTVKGRFAPESQGAGTIVLTADAEAGIVDVAAGADEDDLIVVADEPKFVIDQPKKVVTGARDLEAIFAGGDAQRVGSVMHDDTVVWVAQLPAFAGLDLWDPDVTLAVPEAQSAPEVGALQPALLPMLTAPAQGDDGEPSDIDRDVDLGDEEKLEDDRDVQGASADADDEEQGSDGDEVGEEGAASDGGSDGVLVLSSSDDDDDDNGGDSAAGGGDDGDEDDGGGAARAKGDIANEQRIGAMLLGATPLKSQVKASQQPTQAAQLTPRALQFAADDDLFDAEDAPAAQSSQLRVGTSPAKPLAQQTPGSPLVRVQPALVAATGVPPSPRGPFSASIGTAPPHTPSASQSSQVATAPATKAGDLILDPVERAKRLAASSRGLDRFVVRGDAARQLAPAVSAPVKVKAATVPAVVAAQPVSTSAANNNDDGDDDDMEGLVSDERSDRGSERGGSKRARAMLDDEAIESDAEDDEQDDSEDPSRAARGDLLDGDDAQFPNSEPDSASPRGKRDRTLEAQLAAFNADKFARGGDDDDEDADVFSAESSANDGDVAAEVVEVDAQINEDEDAEQLKALNRLRMEKDLVELNRIKDLYVLGQWKTEKLANRKQLGMEDYLDDEFAPAWNSIYNRDLVKHKFAKTTGGDAAEAPGAGGGGGDDDDGEKGAAVNAGGAGDDGDADLLGSSSGSEGEEEYQRKREKLKQSIQLARVASIFGSGGGEGAGSGEMSRGASMFGAAELSRGGSFAATGGELSRGTSFVFSDASNAASGLDPFGAAATDSMMAIIDNRRETSNAPASGVIGGGFGFLRNAATLDNHAAPGGDPLKRLSLQRSNSKLVLQAQEKNLKRTRSNTGTALVAGINPGGRQFFETNSRSNFGGGHSDSNGGVASDKRAKADSNSGGSDANAVPAVAETGTSRRKSAAPRRLEAGTPSKVKQSLLYNKTMAKKKLP